MKWYGRVVDSVAWRRGASDGRNKTQRKGGPQSWATLGSTFLISTPRDSSVDVSGRDGSLRQAGEHVRRYSVIKLLKSGRISSFFYNGCRVYSRGDSGVSEGQRGQSEKHGFN